MLDAIQQGDPKAAEDLLPLVYNELRKLAVYKMAQEAPGQTLQATALVHEAWLRIAGGEAKAWDGRRHFFAAAAEAMRRILVEAARRKKRLRHGGGLEGMEVEEMDLPAPMPNDELLALDEALTRLAEISPQGAEVVKLCFFVGLTQEHLEAIRRRVLEVSVRIRDIGGLSQGQATTSRAAGQLMDQTAARLTQNATATQELAATVQEIAHTAEDLSRVAEGLKDIVKGFRLRP